MKASKRKRDARGHFLPTRWDPDVIRIAQLTEEIVRLESSAKLETDCRLALADKLTEDESLIRDLKIEAERLQLRICGLLDIAQKAEKSWAVRIFNPGLQGWILAELAKPVFGRPPVAPSAPDSGALDWRNIRPH